MSLLSPDRRREKGGSEWASIVLCSRQFTHTHLPNHTHSLLLYNEINALSFPLCAQHLTVPKASCDQTPHHVLQLLILMLTQCSFCTLVWLFIRIVFSRNKGCLFYGCFYYIFFFGWKCLIILFYPILMVAMLFFLLIFCASDHMSPILLSGVVPLYLVLTLSFQNKIWKLQSHISNAEHGILNKKMKQNNTFENVFALTKFTESCFS